MEPCGNQDFDMDTVVLHISAILSHVCICVTFPAANTQNLPLTTKVSLFLSSFLSLDKLFHFISAETSPTLCSFINMAQKQRGIRPVQKTSDSALTHQMVPFGRSQLKCLLFSDIKMIVYLRILLALPLGELAARKG